MQTKHLNIPDSELKAVEDATAKFIKKQYPAMSDEMAHLWARAIENEERDEENLAKLKERHPELSDEDARIWAEAGNDHIYTNLEEAKALNRSKKEAPEMAEDMKARIEEAREKYYETLERDTAVPEEAAPEELLKLESYLQTVPQITKNLKEMEALAAKLKANRDKLSPTAMEKLYDATEKAFFEACDNRIVSLQPLVSIMGGNEGGEPFVNFKDMLEITLSDLITQGKLEKAKDISTLMNQCRANGYKGVTFLGSLDRLFNYEEAMKQGYKKVLESNEAFAALAFQTEARKHHLDLRSVEKSAQTKLDLDALSKGNIQFPGSS